MKIQHLTPTKILMGKDCVISNAGALAPLGKKALIVTGRNSARANGSLKDVTDALSANGQAYALYDKVMSNPTIACAYEGAAFAKSENCDFVIAIGGGSPMDAAKAMALLARQDIPEEKLFAGPYTSDVLPMVFIPTTAGTGSEVTQYAILTNDRLQTKTSIASPVLFPTIALLDAKYTAGLSHATAVNTAIDALSHSVEGMLSVRANPLSDCLAAEGIRGIASCFKALKSGSLSLEDRESLLYASMVGGLVIANTGTTAVHAMGYSLTYFKDIDHGRANGLLLAEFLRFVEKSQANKIHEILDYTGTDSVDDFAAVLKGLLGEPEQITAEEIAQYADIAITAKNIGNCIAVPDKAELTRVYTASLSR